MEDICNVTEEDLLREIENLINQIPKGKISTFNIIAKELGSEYARKYVWGVIKSINGPWWRVVNQKGEIKDKEQEKKLKEEGIIIKGNKILDMDKYLFTDFEIGKKPLEILRNCQKSLVEKIKLKDYVKNPETIGGVDISYYNNRALVVYVILDKDLKIVDIKFLVEQVDFPYIPTFLAFREGRPIVRLLKKYDLPDVLFVNGQGIAHPVKLGLATYIGVALDIPTIGVTKKHLYGNIKDEKIYDKNHNLIGGVLEKFGKRIYASPGNKISVNTAIKLSNKLWIKGNYPEPLRIADQLSKAYKDKYLKGNRGIKDYF